MSHGLISTELYYKIFATLMALTTLTVIAAFIDMGALNDIIAMGIACTKALLVILFFMHVRYNSPVTWIFVSAGFVMLLIMLMLGMNDYVSRSWDAPPSPWTAPPSAAPASH